MNCVTYKNVNRTNPGGADAHMRTHDREIEVPAVVPSHRRVESELTTIKIARLSQKQVGVVYGSTRAQNGGVGNPEKGLQNGMDRNGGGGKSVRTIV